MPSEPVSIELRGQDVADRLSVTMTSNCGDASTAGETSAYMC